MYNILFTLTISFYLIVGIHIFQFKDKSEEDDNQSINKVIVGKIETTLYKRIPKLNKAKRLLAGTSDKFKNLYNEETDEIEYLDNDNSRDTSIHSNGVYKNPEIILFSSYKSNTLLKECLDFNYSASFFRVSENLVTQNFPTYCALSNLVVILNSLNLDPKNRWKGIWRWYNEETLHCINRLYIDKHGLNLEEFNAIGKCNGLFNMYFRPDPHESETKRILETILKSYKSKNYTEALSLNPYNSYFNDTINYSNKAIEHDNNSFYCIENEDHSLIKDRNNYKQSNFYLFSLYLELCCRAENLYCLISYSRKYLKQTGEGHFGILSTYHPIKKLVLLMEVARFKYDSIWIKIEKAYHSLFPIDSDTKLSRGYLICGKYF